MKHEPSGRERPPANPNRRTARSGLEQRVLRRARDRGLHGVPIVVGFSGGADSLCLAAVLAAIQRNLQISPVLVHVNHGLRPESDKESDRVTELARTLDLPLTLVRLADGLRERHRGVGIEEAARRERYRALATAAKRLGTDLVATAHHQNDQAETVLMHLMRGTGLEGASGMRELSKTTVPWWAESDVVPVSIRLWRPLLQEPKSEIEACVESLTMSPVQDSSNTDRTFRRNSIRHDLLPAMEAVYPGTRGSLARFAEVAAAEDEFMQGLAAEAYARCVQSDGTLNLTEWYGLPTAIQRRVMLKWLRERAGTNEVTFERAISVTDLAQTRRLNATIEVAAGCSAVIIGSDLAAGTEHEITEIAWSRFPGPHPEPDFTDPIRIAVCGETTFGNVLFTAAARRPEAGTFGRDWMRLPFPDSGQWIARLVNHDDRFRDGQRVADWLRAQRVPIMIRGNVACLETDGHVAWVPGLPVPPHATLPASEDDQFLGWSVTN